MRQVIWWTLVVTLTLMVFPSVVLSQSYRFERMWPTLKQPWYFEKPRGVATDSRGNLYITDSGSYNVKKFSQDGLFITSWGKQGTGDSEFSMPTGIAIHEENVDSALYCYVYVIDHNSFSGNDRIQKFTSDGSFIWERFVPLESDEEVPYLRYIAIDTEGYIYVTDSDNNCVKKLREEKNENALTLVHKWGSIEAGDFTYPHGITIDEGGNVYVADSGNNCIQKINRNDNTISPWYGYGTTPGEFNGPTGITIDETQTIYVTNSGNGQIQKFSTNGAFFSWEFDGKADDIAVVAEGYVFITEWVEDPVSFNHRIVKFSPEGNPLGDWTSEGVGEGEFKSPSGIVVREEDGEEHIYVVDTFNDRIQKFTSDGAWEQTWGSSEWSFNDPKGIAIDETGSIYLADERYGRILKINPDDTSVSWSLGSYRPYSVAVDAGGDNVYAAANQGYFTYHVLKLNPNNGSFSIWGPEFNIPRGLTVGTDGYVYVADTYSNLIQKCTPEGICTTCGGGFSYPRGVAVDAEFNIYVADTGNNSIKMFDQECNALPETLGEFGHLPGQLNYPTNLAVGADGRVYVSDSGNNRLQIFKKVEWFSNSKAIIVAGRASPGDSLWDSTRLCANFAYRTLSYQGFTRESIYYLTSDTGLDLDNNGVADDVDADVTNANLEYAITTWAADADNLTIYLTDHGGDDTFRMGELETLSATDLASWLNTLQSQIPGKIIVVYDACESGSFLAELAPSPGLDRIVIASADAGESAYFITQGTISFSYYFWTHIFNGLTVFDAFDLAQQAISFTTPFQHPLLDDDGDGIGNGPGDGSLAAVTYIGNGTPIADEVPVIGEISSNQTITDTNTAPLYADSVTDKDGIARVWAVIRAPDYNQGSPDNPVQELPSIDLMPVGGNRYEITYDNFNTEGTYQILVYALDGLGSTSIPELTTVTVENPLTRKAVIVAGDTELAALWQAIEKNVELAYETLIFQGYQQEDIYFLSPETFHPSIIGTPALSNVEYALGDWAEVSTQDLVVYLIGEGTHGSFILNDTESLTASHLDTLLDDLQAYIPGKVVVVYDACQSGSFLPYLVPPAGKERILAISTDAYQPAYFLAGGDISFSSFFWEKVLNGSNMRDSFNYATDAIRYACSNQTPLLEGNGNGIGNEGTDRTIARYYTIGMGIILAGDAPIIGSMVIEQTSPGASTATIGAYDVTTTGTISQVSAMIGPPGFSAEQPDSPVTDLSGVNLTSIGDSSYEETYDFSPDGEYLVMVYAVDDEGIVSKPHELDIFVNTGRIGTLVCEGDFDCDRDQDGTDAAKFKEEFGRSSFDDPCTGDNACSGDFDLDQDVDGMDASKFKEDFGRSSYNNICPHCVFEP